MGAVILDPLLADLAGGAFGDAAIPRGAPRGWDLLGNVPVPLRQRVRDGVAERAAELAEPLKICFPMGQGGRGPFERLRFVRSLDDYPNMLVSAEHGNAFNRAFYRRHVAAGAFCGAQPAGTAAAFAPLLDPAGHFGVFAVAPFVLLIDHRRLGGLPAPRRWRDLLDPGYRGQVVFGGWRRDGEARYSHYNKFFLLCMALEFGLDGLARVLRNVPSLLHSTQMPRVAGSDSSPGGIYVLPWSLADMCPRRGDTEVVWPMDGALAYPLWLTVKADQRRRLDVLLRHFHGAELGRYLNQNRYPALCPELPPALPAGGLLKWPGWEVVRDAGTARLIGEACRLFQELCQAEGRPCA